jgi:hypothetical protein
VGAPRTYGRGTGRPPNLDATMDGNSARQLAKRLAEKNGPEPTPPIRGEAETTEVAPIFRWFALQPPPAKPA